VVPNNVIAMSQVWNFTRESPKVALRIEIGISYDSDWRLAENVILKILENHPLVLNRPPPYVLMKEFGSSAQVLDIWFWIPEARDKLILQSDILKRIKDAFDQHGIEIPFPYRTVVYKNDLEKPKKGPEPYVSPMYLPSTGYKKVSIAEDKAVEIESESSIILAPTSAPYAAKYTAPYVMEAAKKMSASVTALYILSSGGNVSHGERALRIYNEVAKVYGVEIKLRFEEGNILEKILEAVEEEDASIVIMGSTEETLFGSLTRRSISQELLKYLNIPTMIIPFRKEAEEKFKKIQRMRVEEVPEKRPPLPKPKTPEDFTSLGSLEKISGEEEEPSEKEKIQGFLGA
ncbi:MAG: mechanosensitive ion channel, partial [Deltaproteobacteria bacterium]